MALVLKDRIKETSSTTGTGTLTLGGAVDGFRSFADIGDGNTTYYCIADGNNFEVGIGTYTASGTTLARTTVLQTSAGNTTKITCTGNQKVFVTQPASKAAYLDASNELVVASTALSSIQQRWTKTATSNQTVFNGAADNSGPTLAVNSSSHVFLNGIFLKETTDYALSGGTTVTLTAGATVNDIVEVITFTPLSSSITGISDGDIPVFTSGVADNDFLKVAGTSIEGRSASEVLSDIGGQSALTFGISSGNVPTFTSGVADNDFLKIDGTTVEGRSASEVLSDIGGQASLTFGISNTNAVKIDSTSVADDEYARFTTNGLESRSTAEVLSDIGALSTSSASSTYAPLSGATFTGNIILPQTGVLAFNSVADEYITATASNMYIGVDNGYHIHIDGTNDHINFRIDNANVNGNLHYDANDYFALESSSYLSLQSNVSSTLRSVILGNTYFKPFHADTGQLDLGISAAKWKDLHLNGIGYSSTDFRAPYFRSLSNPTSKYIYPDGESQLTALSIDGGTSNNSNDATLFVSATNNNDWGIYIDKYRGSATDYGLLIDVGSSANYAMRLRGNDSEILSVGGNGTTYVQNDIYATRFRDISNSSRYVDPASNSQMYSINTAGQVQVGTLSSLNSAGQLGLYATAPYISFHSGTLDRTAYIQESGGAFYLYEATFTAMSGSARAPLFYDVSNTSYYCDPYSTSVLNNINFYGLIQSAGSAGSSGQVLTSNGSGSRPTWQDAAGGGAFSPVASTTMAYSSNITAVEFNVVAGKLYKFYFQIYTKNSNNYLYAPIKFNGTNYMAKPSAQGGGTFSCYSKQKYITYSGSYFQAVSGWESNGMKFNSYEDWVQHDGGQHNMVGYMYFWKPADSNITAGNSKKSMAWGYMRGGTLVTEYYFQGSYDDSWYYSSGTGSLEKLKFYFPNGGHLVGFIKQLELS